VARRAGLRPRTTRKWPCPVRTLPGGRAGAGRGLRGSGAGWARRGNGNVNDGGRQRGMRRPSSGDGGSGGGGGGGGGGGIRRGQEVASKRVETTVPRERWVRCHLWARRRRRVRLMPTRAFRAVVEPLAASRGART
jgi:hypothetical protein